MIYLVLNVDNIEEPYVIDICSNKQVADKLREKYIENFIKNDDLTEVYARDIIKVEEIDTSTHCDVFWTAYPDDLEETLTYNIQQ